MAGVPIQRTWDPRNGHAVSCIARVPDALDWLQALHLPNSTPDTRGRTKVPTFIELDTNKWLYVHRRGSNVINGEYYVDYDARGTPGHYSSTRLVDVAGLRKRYEHRADGSAVVAVARAPLTIPPYGAHAWQDSFTTITTLTIIATEVAAFLARHPEVVVGRSTRT